MHWDSYAYFKDVSKACRGGAWSHTPPQAPNHSFFFWRESFRSEHALWRKPRSVADELEFQLRIIIEGAGLTPRGIVDQAKRGGVKGSLACSIDGSFEVLAVGSTQIVINFISSLLKDGAQLEIKTKKHCACNLKEFKFKGNSFSFRPGSPQFRSSQIIQLLAKGEPTVSNFCKEVISSHDKLAHKNSSRLIKLARHIYKSSLSNNRDLFENLIGHLDPSHIEDNLVGYGKCNRAGNSFRVCMVAQGALSWAYEVQGKKFPTWLVDNKADGHRFMEMLGCKIPKCYQAGLRSSEIEVRDNMVIKPTSGAGAKGVFLVQDRETIFDVFAGDLLEESELRVRIAAYLASGTVRDDTWRIEQLIIGHRSFVPIDLKFHCFYGRMVLVTEVQRFPKKGFNWYDTHGQLIRTGKFDNMEFEGEGFLPQHVELVIQASLEIPTPFLRLDFMRSHTGELFFGEFTPRPGKFHAFNPEVDYMMGKEFWAAQARLADDLLSGKKFSKFSEFQSE